LFEYTFGGLEVASNVPLPGLRDAPALRPGNRELRLSLETAATAPAADRMVYRWPGRYGLCLGERGTQWWMSSTFDGTYLIPKDASQVRGYFRAAEISAASADVLVRRVLPRVALRRGAAAVHAAALGHAEGALLLIGESHAGKSTLSAALSRRLGWSILSDDIALVRHEPSVAVLPAATGVCVWEDSRAALDLPPKRCRRMHGYEGKVWYGGDDTRPLHAVPLRALLFLDRSARAGPIALHALNPATAYVEAANQMVRFNPAEPVQQEPARLLHRLTAIVEAVPAWRLQYPSGYAALPDVAERLRDLLQP
jgi:hypothetical protein